MVGGVLDSRRGRDRGEVLVLRMGMVGGGPELSLVRHTVQQRSLTGRSGWWPADSAPIRPNQKLLDARTGLAAPQKPEQPFYTRG